MNSREAFEKRRAEAGKCGWRTEEKFAFEAWQAATERAAVICDEVRHPHGEGCETTDWVNGTFYCATFIRKGNE